MTSLRTVTTTLLVLLLAAGCASTEKRYDKAGDLEAEGRYAEAAAYYIKVLEKEPGYEDARARLRDAGARAIAMLMDEARAAEARSDYDAAVRALDRLEHLIGEADGVGITLQEPDGFAAYRAAVTADGVRWQLARGDEAEREGRWRRALDAYERAATYTADPATRRLLAERQAAAHLGWAEDEAGAARY
ncbi:MAG: hypothetical protein R3247_17370, partial [Rhodothermales bacterium]|nr:hypothetical protein [Rhodothermales bacterium]